MKRRTFLKRLTGGILAFPLAILAFRDRKVNAEMFGKAIALEDDGSREYMLQLHRLMTERYFKENHRATLSQEIKSITPGYLPDLFGKTKVPK